MKDVPATNRPKYKPMWDQAVNKFTAEFVDQFCDTSGAIQWEKLVASVSSPKEPAERSLLTKRKPRAPQVGTLLDGGVE